MNNLPKQWRERLEAEGGDPQFLALMGQTLGQMMDLADKGLAPAGAQVVKEQAESVDWGKAYHDSPHVLTQVAQSFDPTLGAEHPSEDTAFGPLLQETMDKTKGIMERVDYMTDQRTGLFTDEAMRTNELTGVMDCVLPQLESFLIELKVATDHVLALMTWGTTMHELLVVGFNGGGRRCGAIQGAVREPLAGLSRGDRAAHPAGPRHSRSSISSQETAGD